MVSIELQHPKERMIDYAPWETILQWREKEGNSFGHCVLRNHYPPRIEAVPPELEVDEHEEDNMDPAECEAYDNGLDPELDYPAIESECVSTEEEEDDGVLDVQQTAPTNEATNDDSRPEFNFIKVECT